MPKKPFKRHVKFASIDNDDEGPDQGRGSQPSKTAATPGDRGPGHSQSLQTAEIEIHIEDENGVSRPHRYQEQGAGRGGGRRVTSPSHRHQRLAVEDRSDDTDEEEESEGEDGCKHSPQQGPHVVLLTVLCIPFVFVLALVVTGYLGVLTWYNIFLYYYDDRGWIHRIFVCPLLVLMCPPLILSASLGVSIYSSCQQLSWYLSSWRACVTDLEKGFYAWMCLHLGLPECSPYEVITLEDEDEDDFGRTIPHVVSPV